MNKNIVAKEWLVFLMSSVVGVAVGPFVILQISKAIGDSGAHSITLSQVYYEVLIQESGWFVLPISVYVLVILARSILWAIGNMNNK